MQAVLTRQSQSFSKHCCNTPSGQNSRPRLFQSSAVDMCRFLPACLPASGGYFIGCVPDGKRVKAHLVKAPGGKLELPHLVLKSISGVSAHALSRCMCMLGAREDERSAGCENLHRLRPLSLCSGIHQSASG